MKKLSQNGKSKWESRIGNLFDYPFDTAKVHTKVESTKYISSFFHTNRERLFAFFPSARALSIGSSRKTYTSLTTPGLYFISSRKCKIAQSAIYQKISRHLKLFLNIMFVKSPPQQFSVVFFAAHRHFSRRTPRKTSFCRLFPVDTHHPSTGHRAYFSTPRRFCAPAAPIGKPLRHLLHAVGEKLRIAPHCAPHTPPPRTKNGEPQRKNRGLSPKNGGIFSSKHPRFYPPARAHAAQARTKKGLHPNSFVQSFIF